MVSCMREAKCPAKSLKLFSAVSIDEHHAPRPQTSKVDAPLEPSSSELSARPNFLPFTKSLRQLASTRSAAANDPFDSSQQSNTAPAQGGELELFPSSSLSSDERLAARGPRRTSSNTTRWRPRTTL